MAHLAATLFYTDVAQRDNVEKAAQTMQRLSNPQFLKTLSPQQKVKMAFLVAKHFKQDKSLVPAAQPLSAKPVSIDASPSLKQAETVTKAVVTTLTGTTTPPAPAVTTPVAAKSRLQKLMQPKTLALLTAAVAAKVAALVIYKVGPAAVAQMTAAGSQLALANALIYSKAIIAGSQVGLVQGLAYSKIALAGSQFALGQAAIFLQPGFVNVLYIAQLALKTGLITAVEVASLPIVHSVLSTIVVSLLIIWLARMGCKAFGTEISEQINKFYESLPFELKAVFNLMFYGSKFAANVGSKVLFGSGPKVEEVEKGKEAVEMEKISPTPGFDKSEDRKSGKVTPVDTTLEMLFNGFSAFSI